MFQGNRKDQVVDRAVTVSQSALHLAQDKRFRERLISAVAHAEQARRRSQRLAHATSRVVADAALRGELRAARDDLEKAYTRFESKRRNRRLRTSTLAIGLVSLIAIPTVRRRLTALATEFGLREREHPAQPSSRGERTGNGTRPANLDDLTKDELYARAQAAEIPGRSEMSKDELIAALRRAR